MYEQNRVSIIGRIIWLLISLLIIIGLVWFLLWLFVWRSGSEVKPTKSAQQDTTTVQNTDKSSSVPNATTPATSDTTKASSDSQSTSSTTSTVSTGVTSSTSTTVPAVALANTGPGSFVAPIALAFAGGTVYYHIRLRRKVQN